MVLIEKRNQVANRVAGRYEVSLDNLKIVVA
jgi:hypothetical protein